MTDLRRRIAELDWYHTIELAPGVVTPGWFDSKLILLPRLDVPNSLKVAVPLLLFVTVWQNRTSSPAAQAWRLR